MDINGLAASSNITKSYQQYKSTAPDIVIATPADKKLGHDDNFVLAGTVSDNVEPVEIKIYLGGVIEESPLLATLIDGAGLSGGEETKTDKNLFC